MESNFISKLSIKSEASDPKTFLTNERELTFVLPYLGKLSLDLRERLKRTIERDLSYCKLKVIFRSKCSKCRLKTQLRFEDSLEKKIHSGINYGYKCSNCTITYYGKAFRHFYTRADEHMGTPILKENALKI